MGLKSEAYIKLSYLHLLTILSYLIFTSMYVLSQHWAFYLYAQNPEIPLQIQDWITSTQAMLHVHTTHKRDENFFNFPPISLYYRGKYLIELLIHKSSSRSIIRKTYYVLPWKIWGCREGKQPYDRPMRNESDANKRGYQLRHILFEQI